MSFQPPRGDPHAGRDHAPLVAGGGDEVRRHPLQTLLIASLPPLQLAQRGAAAQLRAVVLMVTLVVTAAQQVIPQATLPQTHSLPVAAQLAARQRAGLAGERVGAPMWLAALVELAAPGCRPRHSSQPWPPDAGRPAGLPVPALPPGVALDGRAAGATPAPAQHQAIQPDQPMGLWNRSLEKTDLLSGKGLPVADVSKSSSSVTKRPPALNQGPFAAEFLIIRPVTASSSGRQSPASSCRYRPHQTADGTGLRGSDATVPRGSRQG